MARPKKIYEKVSDAVDALIHPKDDEGAENSGKDESGTDAPPESKAESVEKSESASTSSKTHPKFSKFKK